MPPRPKPYQRTIIVRVQQHMDALQCGKRACNYPDKNQLIIIDTCTAACADTFMDKVCEVFNLKVGIIR